MNIDKVVIIRLICLFACIGAIGFGLYLISLPLAIIMVSLLLATFCFFMIVSLTCIKLQNKENQELEQEAKKNGNKVIKLNYEQWRTLHKNGGIVLDDGSPLSLQDLKEVRN